MHKNSASPPKTARSHQRAHLRGRSCKRKRSPDTATAVYTNCNRLQGFSQTLSTGTATGGATSAANYTMDANGAITSDGLRRYEFDAANRLAAMTVGAVDTSPTNRYVHNALGQRLFKTEPQFPPAAGDENDPSFMASLIAFFSNLWGGSTSTANPSASEKLGYQYYYDEDGSLLYELGAGGANSTGAAHYVYLPTPSGPMPIAFYNGSKHYAIHTDHLNTPRRLTNSSKQVAWQWAFSAFGDEQPTTGKNRYVDPASTPNAGSTTIADVTFNLRYPGQYFDKESNLHYNYFRSYDSRTGRYSQSDPIGLDGGWNRFTYVDGDGVNASDPFGLAACYVSFPDMPIEYSPGKTTTLLGGHAGVLGYDSSGSTRYYEYGRYPPNSSGVFGERLPADDGNFRRAGVPDVQFGADGKPTPASMDALKKALSRAAGKGTDASLICDDTADEKKVYEYLEQLARDRARAKYSWNPLSPNQCRSVAKDAVSAGRK